MIKITPGKDWRGVRALMRNYGSRLSFVRRQVVSNFAEAFLENLEKMAPKDPEFKGYLESLRVVGITGLKGGIGYAVVSEKKKVKLGEITGPDSPYVVYIELTTDIDSADPLSALVSQNNPWPPELIPHGINDSEVELIHRNVSQPELNFIRESTKEFLLSNRPTLASLGAKWDVKENEEVERPRDEMNSLPDYMWQGLRAEFGINKAARPHWRPALRATMGRLDELIAGDKDLQGALYDSLFRKHLETQKADNNMSTKEFSNEAGEFQKKISSGV